MEAIMNIFIVTAGWDYEGICGQWVFLDERTAREKLQSVVQEQRSSGSWEAGDYVTLKGPFAPGDNVDELEIIESRSPKQEAAEAANKARAEKRRLSKARAHSEESGTLRRAEPTDV